ncbi:hypothetical protein EP331_05730 [bacterium]|nr:MAG: hypothetical protein EP331_05730 [bacterium]
MQEQKDITQYSAEYTQELSPTLKNIISLAEKELAYTDMFSSAIELSLYQHIITVSAYKTVLELGMFCGLSTMAFAEAVPADGSVLTIEPNGRYIDLAQRAWIHAPHASKIEIRKNWANLEIPNLISENRMFDFIFIDADKDNYPVYYDILLNRLNKNGTMVLDNMFWYGKTADKSDKKGIVIQRLNEQIKQDERVTATFLPIRDGVVLIRKR